MEAIDEKILTVKDLPCKIIEVISNFADDFIEKELSLLIHTGEDVVHWLVIWQDKINNKCYQESYTKFSKAVDVYNNIEPKKKEEVKQQRIWVGHYYSDEVTLKERTGYHHGSFTADSLQVVMNKILESGLNVMVKQNVKFDQEVGGGTGTIVWASDYRGFTQR